MVLGDTAEKNPPQGGDFEGCIAHFVDKNEAVFQQAYEAFGSGGTLFLNIDIANVLPSKETVIDQLAAIPKTKQAAEKAQQIDSQIVGADEIYQFAEQWISNAEERNPIKPDTENDWFALAEVVFWIRHLGGDWPIDEWLSTYDFKEFIPKLSLNVLADLSMALGYRVDSSWWHQKYRDLLLREFKLRTKTIPVAVDDTAVKLHYIFAFDLSSENENIQDPIHHESIERVRWFSALFPEYTVIGTQGYGHNIVGLDFESSYKQVRKENLLPKWLVWVNSTYSGLFDWLYRQNEWSEYANSILNIRRSIVRVLTKYERELEKYFGSSNPRNLYEKLFLLYREELLDSLTKYPSLPRVAVDPWGFSKEGSKDADSSKQIYEPKGIIIYRFQPYTQALRKYLFNLNNFFHNGEHALILTNGKLRISNAEQKSKLIEHLSENGVGERLHGVSVWNLTDAKDLLPRFQNSFRQLLDGFVDEQNLSRLERDEKKAFERLWHLWYFFAFQPHLIQKNARNTFSRQFKQSKKQLEQDFLVRIQSGLAPELEDTSVTLLQQEIIDNDNKTYFVILIDSRHGWKLYQQVIANIQDTLLNFFQPIDRWSKELSCCQQRHKEMKISGACSPRR